MPQYTYRAQSADGKEVKGVLTAQSEERALALLQSHQLTPIAIEAQAEEGSVLDRVVIGGGVTTKDLVIFTRQIGAMIKAGVPILQALQAFTRQVKKPRFRKLLQQMAYDIEGGGSFSQALAKFPETFSVFFLGVVRTGEASGQLSDSLESLAEYLEQNYVFLRKVRSALMYPVFVLASVILIVIALFIFVVPQLVGLFSDANVALPLPTRILIGVTDVIGSYWYLFIILAVVFGLIIRSYYRTPDGQYFFSTQLLRIPVLSQLFQRIYLARLTSIMHMLFQSDVPVLESLQLAESSIGNRVYQRILQDTARGVKDGANISTVWENEPFIPSMLTTMVSVGERSGEIDKSFSQANRFFRRDVEEILDTITVFIEPILVIVLGIGVGLIVAAVLLPIYNLVLVI